MPCTAPSAAGGKSAQKGINFTSAGSPGVTTAIGIGIAVAKQRGLSRAMSGDCTVWRRQPNELEFQVARC